jgi:leucyl-tRNA synthetase
LYDFLTRMKNYDHRKIERKWQKFWQTKKIYSTLDKAKGKKNFYTLVEFPYPSGNLHVGHWYAFSVPDIFVRLKRMKGFNVLYPFGFDAFGLPAENAAIKRGLSPRKWTEGNIKTMKTQLQSMGASFDWEREVITCDPKYYKWTQWLFLKLFKKGLVYQKDTLANWCPSCKTVLANEQVIEGHCERCGSEVIKKNLLQWNVKITDYAERLLNDLEKLEWPEPIKESQRNWIGKSEGAEIDFELTLKKNKTRFVILHGYTGSAKGNFIPWLKKELGSKGHEVETPELPDSQDPKEIEQVEHVIKNCRFDENTVVIGHSLGGVVAMKTLMKLKQKVSGLVLVAPAIDPVFHKAESRPFWKNFKWNYDYNLIKKLTGGRIAVLSDTKEKLRAPYLKHLADELSAVLIETESKREHFCALKEPDILDAVTPKVRVFTTRPDTIFGATYLILAPEHLWVNELIDRVENKTEVQNYIDKTKKKKEIERAAEGKEKSGVELKGIKAINPGSKEEIPVWIADYVLPQYGTGAIMSVPAHDERDNEFAKKYKLLIQQVIEPVLVDRTEQSKPREDLPFVERDAVDVIVKHWKEDKYLCLQWKKVDWRTFVTGGIEEEQTPEEAARMEVREETGYTDLKFIKELGQYHSKFYHNPKKVNRFAHFHAMYFELQSDTREETVEEEKEKHDVHWIDRTKVADFIHDEAASYAWKLFINPESVYTGEGIVKNSSKFSGIESQEAKDKIIKFVGGEKKTTYKLRDWIVSRQRYWGVPIPIIHCKDCGQVPVPDKDLPIELPEIKDYLPRDDGKSPLSKATKWMNVKCPKCGNKAERETDTLDTFVDSSWYFLRYTDPKNSKEFASKEKMKNWMPVDFYSGGAEHTTMHLLYSRFFQKALFDLGLVKDQEPYKKRTNRGLILGPDGNKMSKRRGDAIDPDKIVENLGADTVRTYLAFIGPFNEVGSYPWSTDGIVGVRRFLERVWNLQTKIIKTKKSEIESLVNETIKKVTEDIESLKLNTAVSQLMILTNSLTKQKEVSESEYKTLLLLLAPFAPYFTEEAWQNLGKKTSIHTENWPEYKKDKIKVKSEIAIQIDGKVRDIIEIKEGKSEDSIRQRALEKDTVKKRIEGKELQKVIYIKGKILSIVTK